jgi:molybdate transport system ATP-binding protein
VLSLQVSKRLAGLALEAELQVGDHGIMVLVGESGAGKTTLLRLIAGLLEPDRGRIEADGETWFDDRAAPRQRPAWERAVGYVAQDYALFPHLTAAENVAYGLRAQRVPARAAATRAAAALERLGIGALGDRRPGGLSGGEQQRVAIARAIVLEPRVLLLDEPLSALDIQTRRAIRGELRRLLAELSCSTLYVTHGPAEALAFGEVITVLERGRVSQRGTAEELMRRPRSPYVAEFLGVNFFRCRSATGIGRVVARIAHAEGMLYVTDSPVESDCVAVVHPRDITVSLEAPAGTARNVFAGAIEELVPEPPAGERVRIVLDSTPPLTAEVTRQSADALGLRPGLRVYASFKAAGVVVTR